MSEPMNVDKSLDDIIKAERSKRNNARRGDGARRGRGARKIVTTPGYSRSIQKGSRRRNDAMDIDRLEKWQHDKFQSDDRGGKRGRGAKGDASTGAKIIVGNLDYKVTHGDINDLFSGIGQIKQAMIKFDKQGRSTGQAEVVFANSSSALDAIQKYNGVPLDNRPLKISLATSHVAEGGAEPAAAVRSVKPKGGRKRGAGGAGGASGASGAGGAGGAGGGGARGGRSEKQPLTKEELDAQLDMMTDVNETGKYGGRTQRGRQFSSVFPDGCESEAARAVDLQMKHEGGEPERTSHFPGWAENSQKFCYSKDALKRCRGMPAQLLREPSLNVSFGAVSLLLVIHILCFCYLQGLPCMFASALDALPYDGKDAPLQSLGKHAGPEASCHQAVNAVVGEDLPKSAVVGPHGGAGLFHGLEHADPVRGACSHGRSAKTDEAVAHISRDAVAAVRNGDLQVVVGVEPGKVGGRADPDAGKGAIVGELGAALGKFGAQHRPCVRPRHHQVRFDDLDGRQEEAPCSSHHGGACGLQREGYGFPRPLLPLIERSQTASVGGYIPEPYKRRQDHRWGHAPVEPRDASDGIEVAQGRQEGSPMDPLVIAHCVQPQNDMTWNVMATPPKSPERSAAVANTRNKGGRPGVFSVGTLPPGAAMGLHLALPAQTPSSRPALPPFRAHRNRFTQARDTS
eukprot:CAMPEP_0198737152 /NCGR_PEP_ID=MMETSP1475-20131203/67718_1 /TAXON_ID= ORGANISM="Unidentified sp., Strain CCMP1999" /NCGR_SAMPLE_ID=MMETSP1475 /ASSEMBLY_ACC=CAM_ASM_001111 /LENGTH=683 /DNA_ID=CAMNT_0044501009 /DNA_START=900 /DNA_END=2951 /DNA_ORIENTATION=-